jgi:hypothetical protein
VSDRALWLEEWCPTYGAAPGSRSRVPYYRKPRPPAALNMAGGRRLRTFPTCEAAAGEPCCTPLGRETSRTHEARLRPGRHELPNAGFVWRELEAGAATVATVLFIGRAGRGGQIDRILLCRLDGDQLIDVERWTAEDRQVLIDGRRGDALFEELV